MVAGMWPICLWPTLSTRMALESYWTMLVVGKRHEGGADTVDCQQAYTREIFVKKCAYIKSLPPCKQVRDSELALLRGSLISSTCSPTVAIPV